MLCPRRSARVEGHAFVAGLAADALRGAFYRNGQPRLPQP